MRLPCDFQFLTDPETMSDLARYFFHPDEDEKAAVLKIYGKTTEDVKKDVGIIRDWLKKQPHLPQKVDDYFLERFLLRNKFLCERTKASLDAYFAGRSVHRALLEMLDPASQTIKDAMQSVYMVPLPKMSDQLERFKIFKPKGDDALFSVYGTMALGIMFRELQLRSDYCVGEKVIIDLSDVTMSYYKKVLPTELAKSYYFTKLHSARMSGFEILNAPSYVDIFMKITKRLMSSKEYSRINFHDNLESLHKTVPKRCLPKEYGGELKSLEELQEDAYQMLMDERDYLLEKWNLVSDEKLRVGGTTWNDYLGIEGTFKNIEMD